jgi:RimJ/RimL family protein N-acetyltransferase
MTMHSGKTYDKGDVSLAAPNRNAVEAAISGNSEDAAWRTWREQAATQDDIYYFAIHLNDVVVGELFLHDIDLNAEEALLGYRIFSRTNRGRGIGRQALHLLLEFVGNETSLKRLVIITAEENFPSRRMAEHCGFELVGPAWEDPQMVVYEWKSSQAQLMG